MLSMPTAYSKSVFLNIPFDSRYHHLFHAIVFAVHDCGFIARSAFETDDGTQIRADKLMEIIGDSKYGIHDISRTGLSGDPRLPRFNMPLELGIFMGAKHFGGSRHRAKRGLVLDRDKYRYQIYCSDIAGQDIRAHNNEPKLAIRAVRNWLCTCPDRPLSLPGAKHMFDRYLLFRQQLPKLCRQFKLEYRDLHFVDYTNLLVGWLRGNP